MIKINNLLIKNGLISNIRFMGILCKRLEYSAYGEPEEVLKITETELPLPKENEVLVKIIAAPINPADINTIQGKYPVKPKFPAIPGNECVGEIIEIGNNVKNFKKSDRVIPFATGLGTWTSHAIYSENNIMKIPQSVPSIDASMLTVNPCTAYRMLKDFINLKSGDCIIQNGANSAVGQAVSQICKAWNIINIGVVRDRSNLNELIEHLKNYGATEILTEEQIRTTNIFKEKYKKPKLGLNCVGGKNALELTRNLDSKGILVTYGGMSREPLTAPTAALIFKDIQFRGFWMTRWTKENSQSDSRKIMFDDLFNLIINKQLKAPPYKLIPFNEYKFAVKNALDMKGFVGTKYILDFSE